MTLKAPTQVELVRKHLLDGKTITPMTALHVYGIYRLSSVIEDLRREFPIDTVFKHDEAGKQYGEYRKRRPLKILCKVQVARGQGIGLPTWVRRLKAATVVGLKEDTARVQFVRGRNIKSFWLNHKELVNVD
jgi:hypothetical protein